MSPVAKAVANRVHSHYAGLWGFVDERIREALLTESVMVELRLQDESLLAGKSAEWLMARIDEIAREAVELLCSKHKMKIQVPYGV